MNNEEKALIIGTLYYYSNIEEGLRVILEGMDFSEEKLLHALKTNQYKIAEIFSFNINRFGLCDYFSKEMQEYLERVRNNAKNKYKKIKEEIKRLSVSINKNNTNMLVLKGIGISEKVYKEDPWIRDFNDVDILVDEKDAEKVYQLLNNELGYHCPDSKGEQLIYKTFFQHYAPIGNNGVWVELHHRLTQLHDPYNINTARILEEADKLYIDDVIVNIPNKEDMLLILCFHLFQHEYRETRFMVKTHADLFNFLYYYKTEINWAKFTSNVEKDNLNFPIAYSLYHVNILYNFCLGLDIVPKEVLDTVVSEDFINKKDEIVSRHLFNEDKPIGIWSKPYMERLFAEPKVLRNELCRKYFFYTSEMNWKKECELLDIIYEDDFKFSPRAWERRGRI